MGGYYDEGGGSGGGFWGDGIWAIIILAMLGFGGGWGGMGFGGGGALNGIVTRADINEGFAFNNISNGITAIQQGICDSTYALSNAMNTGFNSLGMQLANCCCENRAATADLKYTIATENCADRAAIADGLKDVLAATQAQTQAILDKMCQQELDAERRENNNLRSELMYARGQASQVAQTQAIEASQAAQTQYLVNRIAPYPQPAIVYGYNQNWVNPLPTTTTTGGTATA